MQLHHGTNRRTDRAIPTLPCRAGASITALTLSARSLLRRRQIWIENAAAIDGTRRWTDGRTLNRYIDPAPLGASVSWAVSSAASVSCGRWNRPTVGNLSCVASRCHTAERHMNWTAWPEQVDQSVVAIRRVHWSRASASRLYCVLIGCIETVCRAWCQTDVMLCLLG